MPDLRQFLEKTEKARELKVYEGADWDLEIGYLTARNWLRDDAPALLFDKVEGYPAGYRVLTSSIRTGSRIAMVLGLPRGKSNKELLQLLRPRVKQWESRLKRFAPKHVRTGPILENVIEDGNLDVLKFPVPLWHEKDGGRYICTGGVVITRDPDSGEVNLGTYRVMVHDKKNLGIYMSPGRHGRLHMEKYHARNQPCPVAISVGHHPLFFIIGGQQFPRGTEYSYVGAMQGKPVEVITEEVTGLPVPAEGEIVLAGWCRPGKVKNEGPFGEFTGYYASGSRPSPVMEVERIYHRNDPILLGSPPGKPPNETSLYHMLVHSATLHNEIDKAGIPDVTAVCSHEWRNFLIALAIKQRYAGHAKQAALLASELSSTGGIGPKYIVVVDDDIDVMNIKDLMWALCTRSEPAKDIDIIHEVRSSPLDPALRKPAEAFSSSRAILDGCRPYGWMKEFPEVVDFSQEIRTKMDKKWPQ